MAPNSATNLAVGDVINSLQFLKRVVPAFGGSNSKITLAGQSSGADMIRSLLAAPSASSLFESAILQSDPMVSVISNPYGPFSTELPSSTRTMGFSPIQLSGFYKPIIPLVWDAQGQITAA